MDEKNDSALYIGPSHAEGGIPVTVDPDKPGEHPVEVEGIEYKICSGAYQSDEVLSFKQKTNFEILDSIHKNFACKFDQNVADGGDFIICKLAVKDDTRRDRSGTVKQLLDEIQGENGCRLSNGQIAEKKKQRGGPLKHKEPLYGQIIWGNEFEFYTQYAGKKTAMQYGAIDFKNGALLYLNAHTRQNFDVSELQNGNADLYDISKLKIANVSDDKIAREILDKAISLPGNTILDLQRLKDAYPNDSNEFYWIDYLLFSEVKTIEEAAKILGYDGMLLWDDEDIIFPTSAFIWNVSKLVPLIVNNEKNYAEFKKLGHCGCEHKEEGGPINEPEKEKRTGYDARVLENLKQMNAPFEEWRATPITGMVETEGRGGKQRSMPTFDFPKGYTDAPTLYKGTNDNPCCELCGKAPIATVYWIQNDSKKWSLAVGNECVTHFGQGKSGKELERELKVNTAKEFDAKLYAIALWIKKHFYKGQEYSGYSPLLLSNRYDNWRNLWDTKNDFSNERTFSSYYIYNPILPFDYLQQLDKAVKKGAEPEVAKKSTEKKLLLWYARELKQKTRNIAHVLKVLKAQPENFFVQNGYEAPSEQKTAWSNLAKEYRELAGDYLSEEEKLLKGGKLDSKDREYFAKMLPTIERDLKDGRSFAAALMSIKSGIMQGEFPIYKQWFVDKKIIDKNENYIPLKHKEEEYIGRTFLSDGGRKFKVMEVKQEDSVLVGVEQQGYTVPLRQLDTWDDVTNKINQEGITPEFIHSAADKAHIKWDNDTAFMQKSKELTGKEHLDDMNQVELQTMLDYIESNETTKVTISEIEEAWNLIKSEIEKVNKELPGKHDYNWWRSRVNEFFYQGAGKDLPWETKNKTEKLFPEIWAKYEDQINHSKNTPIDFKSVDMQADYDRLNSLLFNGELLSVPLRWIHQKYKIGITAFLPDGSVDYAGVSNFYQITRQQYLDVLAHEMIHVWMAQKGLREPNHHGPIFMAKLEELNSRFPQFKISKTENAADYHLSETVKQKEYGVVLFDENGKYSVVLVNAEVLDDKKAIEDFIEGMKKHGAHHFKNLKLSFYKSSHPDLAKFKIKKSLSLRSMEVFVLANELANEIKQDDVLRTYDFVKQQETESLESQLKEIEQALGPESASRTWQKRGAYTVIAWLRDNNNPNDEQNTQIVIDGLRKAITDLEPTVTEINSKPELQSDETLKFILDEYKAYKSLLALYDEWTKKHSVNANTSVNVAETEQNKPAEEVLIYHRSPVKFAEGKPHFSAFFGTKEFAETYKDDFGRYVYVAKMPVSIQENLLDLNKDTPEAREFMAAVAEQVYPNDKNYPAELLHGDKNAINDFYEIWTDKEQILPEMRKRSIPAVAFHGEYLLPQDSVALLDFIETPLSKNTQRTEQKSKVPELITGNKFLSSTVAEIHTNTGLVNEYTYKQIDALAEKITALNKKIKELPKRDSRKQDLQKEIDSIKKSIDELNIANETRFFNQTADIENLLREFSISNYLLTKNETNEESEEWRNLLTFFWMSLLERPGIEAYWENTAEFVWRDTILDYRLNQKFASGETVADMNVNSVALNKILPAPVAGLTQYLMLRSSGNKLEFAGYQVKTENDILPSWQIAIKNESGVLDQQEINIVFDLRAKVIIRNDVTTIILPYDVQPGDYKRAYSYFEVIKNELIDYRLRIKTLFLNALQEEEKLNKNSGGERVIVFKAHYDDFYFAFHRSAKILHRELGFPVYSIPIQKHEQRDFGKETNDYVIFKQVQLSKVKKLKKEKGISVFFAEPIQMHQTARLIALNDSNSQIEQKLFTLMKLLRT